MKCSVCQKPATESEYCRYHEMANMRLKQVYVEWKEAFEDVGWESYLEQVSGLKETGTWAKDVCRNELQKAGPNKKFRNKA